MSQTCVEITCRAPCRRDSVGSMAWSFQAIDATLSPRPRRLDGVDVHEGPRNISQDNDFHTVPDLDRHVRGDRGEDVVRRRVES